MHSKVKKRRNPNNSKLRIIAGEWRGRLLPIPQATGLRPTGDRVRETLFNWLMNDIEGSTCLDMFAGSGALGFEALSRGARHVDFFELQPQVAQQIQSNIDLLNTSKAKVLKGDALHLLREAENRQYDIAFVDPPFSQLLWQTSLDSISGVLNNKALIYVELPTEASLAIPDSCQIHKEKAFGDVRTLLLRYLEHD